MTTARPTTKSNPVESEIANFFSGSRVFVTGATGFLGKMVVEKLLRACPDIGKIYILIREKKGKKIEERLEHLLSSSLFDLLKKSDPAWTQKALTKIELVKGDCIDPNLGLADSDRQKLIDEIDCVIHCAATVRFDEKIRKAAYINIRATQDLLNLAREMKHLKSFVYVSTAFSNCVRKDIDEVFYEPILTGEKLMALMDALDDGILETITPQLLGDCPNTYIFTKASAESVIRDKGKGLPIAVVRPSIVCAAIKEPMPGWIDNFLGATGMFVGVALGVIRTLHCYKNCTAEMVPADYVVNCIITSAWDIGTRRNPPIKSGEEEIFCFKDPLQEVPIYNYVSSVQKPITWKTIMEEGYRHAMSVPSVLQVWHYFFILNSNYYMHLLCVFLFHRIPAYIVDLIAWCIGKEPILVKGYEKIEKFMDVVSYFALRDWNFKNDNTQKLWKKLNKHDQSLFDFNMDHMDWNQYFYDGARGGRVYLLKDPLETVPQGRIRYLKLTIAHYTLLGLLLWGLYKLAMTLLYLLF